MSPVTGVGTSKADSNAVAMEFACTMFPIKPNAMMSITEKMAARGFDPRPLLM